MTIPPVPPGAIPKLPEGGDDKENAIASAKEMDTLVGQIKEDIQQKAPHSALEENVEKLEKHLDELKKLISHTPFHKSFDHPLFELNAELLKIKTNFGKDEKGMVDICTEMRSNLSKLIEHLKNS